MTSMQNKALCWWNDKVFQITGISLTKTLTCLVKSNGFVIFVFGTGCIETDAFCYKKPILHALENACAMVRAVPVLGILIKNYN